MSKQVLVQQIQPDEDGPVYAPLADPADFNVSQTYAHQHIEQVTRDFLNSVGVGVAGFDLILSTGINTACTVTVPGRVYNADGKSFELFAEAALDIAAADGVLPRVDLIYAQLATAQSGNVVVRPHVRLRTQEEWEDGAPSYAPQQFEVATELHNRVTVGIRTGTPSANPSPPALEENEIALYLIKVGKAVTALRNSDVVDLRESVRSLRVVDADGVANKASIANLNKRIASLPDEILIQLQGLFGSAGDIRSLQEIIADLETRVDAATLPEVLRPKLDRYDANSGKLSAVGAVDGSTPVVDIELNSVVAFSTGIVELNPRRFVDKSRLARFVKVSGGAATTKHEQALTLATVSEIQTDGGADFALRGPELAAARSRTACAGRDSRYIEIFGGLAANNFTKLGDWSTYDSVSDTLTPRTLTGDAIPNADRAAMFSYGDGTHVLVVAGATGDTTPDWFSVNAVTGVSTLKTGTLPEGNWFFGDLITPGKIFIIAVNQNAESDNDVAFWIFDTGAGTFTQVGVSGNVPNCERDYSHGCYYRNNEFVLVEFTPGLPASGKTYVFNYLTSTWTRLSIAAPFGGTDEQSKPVNRFRLANYNGRPVMVGGQISQTSDPDVLRAWELTIGEYSLPNDLSIKRPRWKFFDTSIPPIADAAMASTVLAGVTRGTGFLIAGEEPNVKATTKVYVSQLAGLIETVLDGVTGLTVSDNATFASFVVPVYTAPWEVAGYVASLEGDWRAGMVKLEVSFDAGDHWHQVNPDQFFAVTDSDTPAVRHARITLYSFKSSKPIVTNLFELLDEDGDEVEERYVLRFNIQTGWTSALYLSRSGAITLSATIEPSTPDKALLLKITPDGSSAPDVLPYVNKRRAHLRYRGTQPIAPDLATVVNDLSVVPTYVRLMGATISDGILYEVPDPPLVAFDTPYEILAWVNGGDDYILEVEG